MPLPPPFEARLLSSRLITPGVCELVFERTDGASMAFEPGQWVNIMLAIGGVAARVKRSYSIASAPNESPRFEIAVTLVQDGAGSAFLHSLAPGTVLPFIGPQGFFTRTPAGAPPSLMVATGTGVTPLRSMIRAAVALHSTQVPTVAPPQPMWLLLGVRHEEDLLYGSEFEALAGEHPFIRFEPTLSQPRPSWPGRRGYVQTHVRELWAQLVAHAGSAHAYICGLERMVGSVRALLRKELGLPREVVHTERYD
jgi:ferredoxin-NADP reductase